MTQYISKDAVVAEIEKCINRCNDKKKSCPVNTQIEAICDNIISAYKEVLSLINTLEVKEVDLEKEIREEYLKRRCYGGRDNMLVILNEPQFNMIAKHFFELGLNASNPLTWEDIKTIYLLVQVEWTPKKTDEEIYKEVLKRFKAKKGEDA